MMEEMKGLGWTERDLARQRKGDPRKVVLARRLTPEVRKKARQLAIEMSNI